MKGMFLEDSMSNLTSASNEASLSSSSNKNEVGTMYPPFQQMQQSSFASVPVNSNNQTQTIKKKRNLPGNPDPEAEVISMSPKSLMATNRFVCEICSKGFQRDQNLQLHRRGHNLPWKLKQRSKQEVVRKKVYVCPEPSCVHHEPARALGDLTGIKKHFSRKHGEKKWKCEKCSKRYAVQSDWKAHSKICGTRKYRCDCGTLFSRRDSFITHRAFCGALAGENARSSSLLPLHLPINFPLKAEPQHPQINSNTIANTLQEYHHQLPSWFVNHHQQHNPIPNHASNNNDNENNNNLHLPSPSSPPHMSATALLQKAAQMGVTVSKPATSTNTAIDMSQQQQHQSILSRTHQHDHMCAPTTLLTAHQHASGLGNLSSSDHGDDHQIRMMRLNSGFANVSSGCLDQSGSTTAIPMNAHPLITHANPLMACTSPGSTSFQEAYNGMLSSSKIISDTGFQEAFFPQASGPNTTKGGGGNDELTRDFLGLRGFPPQTADHHFLSMAGLDYLSTPPYHYQQQNNTNQNENQLPWHG